MRSRSAASSKWPVVEASSEGVARRRSSHVVASRSGVDVEELNMVDHGGVVEVDSFPGNTVFQITLPVTNSNHNSGSVFTEFEINHYNTTPNLQNKVGSAITFRKRFGLVGAETS